MKNNVLFSLLLFVVSVGFIHAQPGPYGTDVHATFKDDKGNYITPDNRNFDIKWVTRKSELLTSSKWTTLPDTLSYKTDTTGNYRKNWGTREQIFIKDDTVYIVNVRKTPAGGGLRAGAHFLIIKNNADTMRLYPPIEYFDRYLYLDDIYFKKGDYAIPALVYAFHSSLKKEYRKLFRPNLYSDWELFRVGSKTPIYKQVYAECTELFEDHETASRLLSSLSTSYHSSDWFYEKYFDNLHYGLRGGVLLGSTYHANEDERDENYHYRFGVLPSGIFIYQGEEDGVIEYGCITVPINITDIKTEDSKDVVRFKNLNNAAVLSVTNMKGHNKQPYYMALGYYNGIRQYFENNNREKAMWGFYKLYVKPPAADEQKRIAAKHAKDNNLNMDEATAKQLFDKR